MNKKKTTRRKNKKTSVSKSVKKYVKNAIHSNIENKKYTIYGTNIALPSAVTGVYTPYGLYCNPILSNGTGQAARIGNVVKIARANLTGFLNVLPTNASTNPLAAPVLVRMFILRNKIENTSSLTGMNLNDFFESGSGSVGFQGNLLDMVFKVNSEVWTVYKTKTFKIGASSSGLQTSSSGYFDDSPMIRRFSFDLTKYLTRTQKYNDTATTPTNNNLWVFFQVVRADGVSASATTLQSMAEMHYNIEVQYEDA